MRFIQDLSLKPKTYSVDCINTVNIIGSGNVPIVFCEFPGHDQHEP